MRFRILAVLSTLLVFCGQNGTQVLEHLSSVNGDLEVPNTGDQQTATAVFDVDKDGVNDFLITERSQAPSVVWYRHTADGWQRHVVDDTPLRIEAGSAVSDIDGDGDQDVVFAGDSGSNLVWWWENPYPDFDPEKPWNRYFIKESGENKHHDQMFGDFDGDGIEELVFWNQGNHCLCYAEIPERPAETQPWPYTVIYSYSDESEPEQRGEYPDWKGINEHEGLAKADIDGDGVIDIIGGGRWFKHEGGTNFSVQVIDNHYAFSRCAAGQLIRGGRPEVVLVVGDGTAPMLLYQWVENEWQSSELLPSVADGHSLDLVDYNGDGHLDIFNAEMRISGRNPEAKTRILEGDSKGNFFVRELLIGFGLHESRMVDLDGDNDFDILGKPYNWEAPRLDIWLQKGS